MSMNFSMADPLTKQQQDHHHHHQKRTLLETAAWAAKILFLFIGIASTVAAILKLALPYILPLLSSPFPKLLNTSSSSLSTHLSPLYIFITVHFIIAVIWKLQDIQSLKEPSRDDLSTDSPSMTLPTESAAAIHTATTEIYTEDHLKATASDASDIKEAILVEQVPWPPDTERPNIPPVTIQDDVDVDVDDHNYSSPTPIPDGLDATWRAIVEGKSSPNKKQIKKSDTWEKRSKPIPALAKAVQPLSREAAVVDRRVFSKSNTFRETTTTTRTTRGSGEAKPEMRKSMTFRESVGWRGRDVLVMSQDELFHKGEAFIKMNYDQMRMQRQDSLLNAAC